MIANLWFIGRFFFDAVVCRNNFTSAELFITKNAFIHIFYTMKNKSTCELNLIGTFLYLTNNASKNKFFKYAMDLIYSMISKDF